MSKQYMLDDTRIRKGLWEGKFRIKRPKRGDSKQ